MTAAWPRAILLLLSLCTDFAAAEPWQALASPDPAVQLWVMKGVTKEAATQTPPHDPRPYDIVRAETEINAPILPLLALLQDAGRQREWLPFTQDVRVVAQPAPHQTLVQFRTVTRWPFRPRDAITLFDVMQLSAAELRIEMENQPDALPEEPGYLRIRQAEGHWLLSALDHCRTRVRYQSGSRWGGVIPQWLVNSSNRDLAVEALLNLSQWAQHHHREYEGNNDLYPQITAHHHCR